MLKLSRRNFLIISGFAISATIHSALDSRGNNREVTTYSLDDTSLPAEIKLEIKSHNSARTKTFTSTLKSQIANDFANSKSIWYEKSLVSFAQFR